MMKNNSMTNFTFVSAQAVEVSTFNINNQAAVLESDPYQFLDNLNPKVTGTPRRVESRMGAAFPVSLN